MLDQDLIARKIESLRRCVERLELVCPASSRELESSLDIQDILSINLERAIQLCVDIANHVIASQNGAPSETMGESFQRLTKTGVIDISIAEKLRTALGFRNLSVHAYDKIDWKRVWHIVQNDLNDFRKFAQEITNYNSQ